MKKILALLMLVGLVNVSYSEDKRETGRSERTHSSSQVIPHRENGRASIPKPEHSAPISRHENRDRMIPRTGVRPDVNPIPNTRVDRVPSFKPEHTLPRIDNKPEHNIPNTRTIEPKPSVHLPQDRSSRHPVIVDRKPLPSSVIPRHEIEKYPPRTFDTIHEDRRTENRLNLNSDHRRYHRDEPKHSNIGVSFSYNTRERCYYFGDNYRTVHPREYYCREPARRFYFFVDFGLYENCRIPEYVVSYQYRTYRSSGDIFACYDPISEAYKAFACRNYYLAKVKFGEALRINSGDGLLWFGRAQTNIAIGDYNSAYYDLVQGMNLIPDWQCTSFNIKKIYSDPCEFDRHVAGLRDWLYNYPNDYRARFTLGYLYYFNQQYDECRREFSCISSHPEYSGYCSRFLVQIGG